MADEPRYPETRDVASRALLLFGGGLVLFLVLTVVVLRLIFDTNAYWPLPGAAWQGNEATPAMQRFPAIDLAAFRDREDKELAKLGWVDRAAGIARIPIGDAMELVARNGLPDWSRQLPARVGECAFLGENVPRAPQAARCQGQAGQGEAKQVQPMQPQDGVSQSGIALPHGGAQP
ncbi:hypothetical protein A9K65_021795 [Mesorhizobium sp. WSM1497]|uniref:hypothetical protein n=1 Tax=Mesorhizobium sp. WSM1497 TaxID=278153 RepID=UPI0007EDF45C|nr:hypothetical protein [Mesorhizobium sp. WSM1497]ARP65684.1 hypothetical protein A9K65_021795 [Mesorhizobium sp. WSM1497]